jgi:hypothetical protein
LRALAARWLGGFCGCEVARAQLSTSAIVARVSRWEALKERRHAWSNPERGAEGDVDVTVAASSGQGWEGGFVQNGDRISKITNKGTI